MTRDFYAPLRQHAIRTRTLSSADGDLAAYAFERGVHHAWHCDNLMQGAFSVRTPSLFGAYRALRCPVPLSGLVIGEDLRSSHLRKWSTSSPLSACLRTRSATKLRCACWTAPARSAGPEATWRGLWAIGQRV